MVYIFFGFREIFEGLPGGGKYIRIPVKDFVKYHPFINGVKPGSLR